MKGFYDTCESLAMVLERLSMGTGAAEGVKRALAVAYKDEICEAIVSGAMLRNVKPPEHWDEASQLANRTARRELFRMVDTKARERFVVLVIADLQEQAAEILKANDREWALMSTMTDEQILIVSQAWDTAPEAPSHVAARKANPL